MFQWLRIVECCSKEKILFVRSSEHSQPLNEENQWMKELLHFKLPDGPRFSDGSINWQCSCMGGGSMVAHHCGHYFRRLYVCISNNDYKNANINCPEEFVDWSACMQNLPESRKEHMRRAIKEDGEDGKVEK